MKKKLKPVKYICTVSIYEELDTIVRKGTVVEVLHTWFSDKSTTGRVIVYGEHFNAAVSIPAALFPICFEKYRGRG